jgi:hypothetical protein
MTMPTEHCAETGVPITIRGDGTYPFINLDGLGGVYFASAEAKERWCAKNVHQIDGRWVPQKAGQVTINGQVVAVTP